MKNWRWAFLLFVLMAQAAVIITLELRVHRLEQNLARAVNVLARHEQALQGPVLQFMRTQQEINAILHEEVQIDRSKYGRSSK